MGKLTGTWPCSACGQVRAKDSTLCPSCGSRNIHPDFTKQIGTRVVIAVAGPVVILFILFLIVLASG